MRLLGWENSYVVGHLQAPALTHSDDICKHVRGKKSNIDVESLHDNYDAKMSGTHPQVQ